MYDTLNLYQKVPYYTITISLSSDNELQYINLLSDDVAETKKDVPEIIGQASFLQKTCHGTAG